MGKYNKSLDRFFMSTNFVLFPSFSLFFPLFPILFTFFFRSPRSFFLLRTFFYSKRKVSPKSPFFSLVSSPCFLDVFFNPSPPNTPGYLIDCPKKTQEHCRVHRFRFSSVNVPILLIHHRSRVTRYTSSFPGMCSNPTTSTTFVCPNLSRNFLSPVRVHTFSGFSSK